MEPGEYTEIEVQNRSPVKVKATAGPVLGPPWQRPENGYFLRVTTVFHSESCIFKLLTHVMFQLPGHFSTRAVDSLFRASLCVQRDLPGERTG